MSFCGKAIAGIPLSSLTVIANFAAIFSGQTLEWLYYLPLPPLFLLMLTGLYMFFRPYFRKRASLEAK
jgi:hypothetical protein